MSQHVLDCYPFLSILCELWPIGAHLLIVVQKPLVNQDSHHNCSEALSAAEDVGHSVVIKVLLIGPPGADQVHDSLTSDVDAELGVFVELLIKVELKLALNRLKPLSHVSIEFDSL